MAQISSEIREFWFQVYNSWQVIHQEALEDTQIASYIIASMLARQ